MTSAELEIALWPRGPQAEQEVASLLQRYHLQDKLLARVRARYLNAENPWGDVSQIMTYQNGADITEVGASWVESIIATNSLRPFSPAEFQSFGGADAFLLPPWKSEEDHTGRTVYSIPYRADARLIYYRRDLLAQAGVDESTAFTTSKRILQTLESLKCTGIKSPFVAPLATQRFMNLSFMASWLWSAGADFLNSAGTSTTFDQPAALGAIADYFRTADYIAPEFRSMDPDGSDLAFCRGDAAVALSGPWMFYRMQDNPEFAHVKANMGIAIPPGQACRGGTHLVVWDHSMHEEAAFDFIRFLTSAQVQADLSGSYFILPARLEAIRATQYAEDPNYQMIVKAILTGRSYGASPLWNIVEDRLSRVLAQLWPEYFETPGVDLDAFLAIRLKPLARRINITLER